MVQGGLNSIRYRIGVHEKNNSKVDDILHRPVCMCILYRAYTYIYIFIDVYDVDLFIL
jgi:hypothetical protein